MSPKKYPWVPTGISFERFFEFYGDGNHGKENSKLNNHGYRIVALLDYIGSGPIYEYSDTGTFFVVSNFDKMLDEDKKNAKIISEVEVNHKDLFEGFLFCAHFSEEVDRRILLCNPKRIFAEFNF